MPNNHSEEPFLPAFCQPTAVFFVVLVGELLAVLLSLSNSRFPNFNWQYLGLSSIFILWVGLLSAALLCAMRGVLSQYSLRVQVLAAYLVIIGLSAMCGAIAVYMMPTDEAMLWRLIRIELISMIVAGLGCRYFLLQHQHRLRMQAHLQTRIEVLQSRIRPHFMFNTLNSIASIIAVDADKAEALTLDFAELMRESGQNTALVPLAKELHLCRQYVAIEQVRFGQKLQLHWQVSDACEAILVPNLLLQPLIENAIYHGIQQRVEGGVVGVSIQQEANSLHIVVTNPLPESNSSPVTGQQLAVNNIKHRLEALYDSKAEFSIDRSDSHYRVSIVLPLGEHR